MISYATTPPLFFSRQKLIVQSYDKTTCLMPQVQNLLEHSHPISVPVSRKVFRMSIINLSLCLNSLSKRHVDRLRQKVVHAYQLQHVCQFGDHL